MAKKQNDLDVEMGLEMVPLLGGSNNDEDLDVEMGLEMGPLLGGSNNDEDNCPIFNIFGVQEVGLFDVSSNTSSTSSRESPPSVVDVEQTSSNTLVSCEELCNAINDQLRVKGLLSENESYEQWKDKHGSTPLHQATNLRQMKRVEIILKAVASHAGDCVQEVDKIVNAKGGKNKETPLHIAVSIGWVDGVCLLLEANADITATDKSGKTVLHLALSSKKSQQKEATQEEIKFILEKLLQHEKCNEIINVRDNFNQSPLFLSIASGKENYRNIELVKLLLLHEAHCEDVYTKQIDVKSALFCAVEKKQPEIVKLLIEKAKYKKSPSELKEYLDEDFSKNMTRRVAALHIAVQKDCVKCVTQLLDAGCDISKTALIKGNKVNVFHMAAELKDADVMGVLVKHLEKEKSAKQKLLKEIYECLKVKSKLLKPLLDKPEIITEVLSCGYPLKADAIDDTLKIANESKFVNDPSTWAYDRNTTRSTPEQLRGSVTSDKRLTIKNNSDAIWSLLNEKCELFENLYRTVLNTSSEALANELTDSQKDIDKHDENISNLKQKVSHIDDQFKLLNMEERQIQGEKGRTPLQIACNSSRRESIKLLIQAGADLTVTCTSKNAIHPQTTLMDMIIHSVPDSVDLFQGVFDSSIKIQKEFVEVDYNVLLPDNTEKDNFKIINAFLSTGNKLEQRKLLEHPLIQSFLQLQWERLKIFYLIYISFYIILVLSLNILLYSRYIVADRHPSLETTASAFTGVFIVLLIIYVEISYVALSIKFVYKRQKTELCIKALCYTMSFVLIFTDLPREYAVLTVGLSLIELIFLLSHIPWYGTYLLIFIEVTSAYFVVILSFSFIIIQFMFIFMVLFWQNDSPFNTVSNSLTKVFIMMIGELDYEALFKTFPGGDVNSLYFAQFVMIVFILLVGIVLVNLLIVKAITDVKKIDRIRIQATSMNIYDKTFFDLSRCTMFSRAVHTVVIYVISGIQWMCMAVKRMWFTCWKTKFVPGRELFYKQWRQNCRIVFKLQLNIKDRSCSSVPINDNVVNLLVKQGFINSQESRNKFKEERRLQTEESEKKKLRNEMQKILSCMQEIKSKVNYLPASEQK